MSDPHVELAELVDLSTLREHGAIDALARQFAEGLCAMVREQRPEVKLALALVSRQVGQGHVCLDLPAVCNRPPTIELDGETRPIVLPARDAWVSVLRDCALVASVSSVTGDGAAHPERPLVLVDDRRLYLRRHYEHERALLDAVRQRIATPQGEAAPAAALRRLFPDTPGAGRGGGGGGGGQLSLGLDDGEGADLQRIACERAARRSFFVISGGPGTGKTSTVVKLLALLVEQAQAGGRPPPRMHLMAPTGKAAARLSSSIQLARDGLDVAAAVREAIPESATTIHRALGVLGGQRVGFRHDRRTPLVTDLVLVDEASMVDLALMRRLLDAVPEGARVILLGDRNQLSSVEAGAVLGDLCGAGLSAAERAGCAIDDAVVHLTRSYRYSARSGIGRLADAINRAHATEVLELLRSDRHGDVVLCEEQTPRGMGPQLAADVVRGYRAYLEASGPRHRLSAFDRFRVLCAHRRGPHGVEDLNERIAELLHAEGLIAPPVAHYDGRPVLVTHNDYQAGLFNGDVGTVAIDPKGGSRVHFIGVDGEPRSLSTARLPPHESVYAMSIHKSQGSEFDEIAVVLPDASSALLSRELLYTAVTRARKRVVIHATADVIKRAVETDVQRASGLRDALWPRA